MHKEKPQNALWWFQNGPSAFIPHVHFTWEWMRYALQLSKLKISGWKLNLMSTPQAHTICRHLWFNYAVLNILQTIPNEKLVKNLIVCISQKWWTRMCCVCGKATRRLGLGLGFSLWMQNRDRQEWKRRSESKRLKMKATNKTNNDRVTID